MFLAPPINLIIQAFDKIWHWKTASILEESIATTSGPKVKFPNFHRREKQK